MNVKAGSLKRKYVSMAALSMLKSKTFTIVLVALHTTWRGVVPTDKTLAFN